VSAVNDLRALAVDHPEMRWNAVREYLRRCRAAEKFARPDKPSVFDAVTVADVLRRTGHGANIPANPKRLMKCPLHEDDSPSMRIFDKGFRCFGCGQKGGIADLAIALGYARTYAEAALWLENSANS
jgi:hypothetical protein